KLQRHFTRSGSTHHEFIIVVVSQCAFAAASRALLWMIATQGMEGAMTSSRLLIRAIWMLPLVCPCGCLPASDVPLSAVDKAKPDDRLLGKWHDGTDAIMTIKEVKHKDVPAGVRELEWIERGEKPDYVPYLYFVTTTIDKLTYANVFG